jgi:hypothetical protein
MAKYKSKLDKLDTLEALTEAVRIVEETDIPRIKKILAAIRRLPLDEKEEER